MVKDVLAGLNPQQVAAVKATKGPVLIFAGAGSGKTRVLTHRVAYLIKNENIPPEHILAVTFTNKAAQEMRERLFQLLGEIASGLHIGTFHAICARILRREALQLGYERNFTIYDDEDSRRLLKRIIADEGLEAEFPQSQAVLQVIRDYKNRLIEPTEAHELAQNSVEERLALLYELYQTALKKNNALDFDDLLLLPLELFRRFPQTLKRYQRQFQFILVDEYQDTNQAQFRLVKLLSGEQGNLCVVGDDDQSIYGWRGADITNILEFRQTFPGARVFKLERNYRSTRTIVAAASALVGNNQRREPKELWADGNEGEKLQWLAANDDREEARLVVAALQEECGRGNRKFSDFAILYRTNAQSRSLEEFLRRAGIPYQIVGGVGFYDRKEIKDVLAYFQVVLNTFDSVSLMRIINDPPRGIGKVTQEKLNSFALSQDISLFSAMMRAEEIDLSPRAKKQITAFVKFINKYSQLLDQLSLEEWARVMVEDLGYFRMWKEERTPESQARLENLQELLNAVGEYAERTAEPTLAGFLEEVSLLSDVDSMEDDKQQVTLMTVHAAKGLEFPIVFITGMEEGLFPIRRALMNPHELEEERRLFYVALTRAKEKVYLSHARQRRLYGDYLPSVPSRFLGELPADLIEHNSSQVSAPSNITPPPRRPSMKPGDVTEYAPGQLVEHAVFGKGRILEVEGQGNNSKLTVVFQGRVTKRLLARYAHLRILEQ